MNSPLIELGVNASKLGKRCVYAWNKMETDVVSNLKK